MTDSGAIDLSGVEFEDLVAEMIRRCGDSPDREGMAKTPERVAKAMSFLTKEYGETPEEVVGGAIFPEAHESMVLVKDIELYSMCEHHLLPFMGKAHIGYMPNGKVLGLSKLARVVDDVSRRPQVQERMTEEVANLLLEELDAKGVAVVVEATHSCMTIRGVRKPGSLCVTSAMKGIFRSNLSTRSEIMQLIYGQQRR